MLTPLVLVFVLMVATAAIAYWSDNLGKKLGKKRVSLFGLRPKTTATLLTIASSWGIMLFTLIVLLLVYVPIRKALLGYDRERQRNEILQNNTRILRGQVTELEGRSREAEGKLKTTQGQFQETRLTLDRARNQLSLARNSLAKAQDQESRARKREAAAEAQARRVGSQLAERQHRLDEIRRKLDQNNKQLEDTQFKLASLNQRSVFMRAQLNKNGKDLLALTKESLLAEQRASESEAKLGATQAQQKDLEREQSNLKTLLASLESQRSDLQRQSVTLNAQVEFLKDQAREYEEQAKKYGAVAAGDVGLPVSVTLAARILPPHQTVEQVRQALTELLHDGEENLPTLLNIPEGEGNTQPPRLRFKEQTGDLRGRSLLEDKANLFADKDDPISVRLLPERNFLIGERDIAADIAYVVVRPALPEGAELAVGTVDGTTGDAKIFNFLLNLTDAGKVYAERAGIQPARAPRAPEFYVRGTNELVFETLRKIAAIKRPVRVHMLAAEDLSTVDQLKVKFELEDDQARTGTSH